jgi:hypothetical protein
VPPTVTSALRASAHRERATLAQSVERFTRNE